MKPSSAAPVASLNALDRISEVSSSQVNMRLSVGGNNRNKGAQQTVAQPLSAFNLQLSKIREKEEEVKRAIETSSMLLSLQSSAFSSSHHLKDLSTRSRLPIESHTSDLHSGHTTTQNAIKVAHI